MYIKYFNELKALINNRLNTVKTVDWFNNQYNRTEDLKAVAYPIVYIEFPNSIWDTAGKGLQTSKTSIKFHVIVKDVGDSPEPVLELAQELHKIMHRRVLKNTTEQLSSAMVRRESELLTEYNQLKIFTLNYDTMLYDCSTMPVFVQAPNTVGIDVNGNINNGN